MKNYLKYFVPFIVLISVSSIFLSCMKKMTNPETLAEEMAVAQNAVNLGQNTLNTITSIDPSGKIVFSQNSDDLQTLQPGNIIVSGPLTATDAVPNGFLKRVESKNVVGATVELTTSDASLEDVFESVTIDTQITLTA